MSDPDSLESTTTADQLLTNGSVAFRWYISKVENPQKENDGHWTVVETPATSTDGVLAQVLSNSYMPLGDCIEEKTTRTLETGWLHS